ncbi:MAG: GNAT family N-acetyltransferase [Anaerolineae bacterium]|nr:GNAT family N-acetyltransferase [Anaerolineae bacterium]
MVAQAVRQRKAFSGLRPVDPSRDMRQVAALMERAFGGHLTRQSREALRELKIMSHFGPFLWLLDRTSPEFHESFRGFVWVEEGRIVGNVNVGRIGPYSLRWLISNVAVRLDYQGRGIAHHLVQAAIDLAREHGGKWAVLQVHTDNVPARRLYQHLGFKQIAAVTELRLERVRPVAFTPVKGFVLRRRNHSEWRKEYELASAVTSKEAQWLRPVRDYHFVVGLDQRLSKWLSNLIKGRREHRLAVEDGGRFIATLTVQASRWRGEHSLELMVHPDHRGQLEEMLITKALSILGDYPERGVAVSHPADHREAIEALKLRGFVEKRTLAQMRLALTSN